MWSCGSHPFTPKNVLEPESRRIQLRQFVFSSKNSEEKLRLTTTEYFKFIFSSLCPKLAGTYNGSFKKRTHDWRGVMRLTHPKKGWREREREARERHRVNEEKTSRTIENRFIKQYTVPNLNWLLSFFIDCIKGAKRIRRVSSWA